MKKLFAILIFKILLLQNLFAQEISPYIKVGLFEDEIVHASKIVKANLEAKGFEIIGDYNPENKPNLKVVVFTRKDLQETVLKIENRGLLASTLKVGLKSAADGTVITYLNPDYLFNAFLQDEYTNFLTELTTISQDVAEALVEMGDENLPFGGKLKVDFLRKYQYNFMMPGFNDPIKLRTFDSFEQGIAKIQNNLFAKKENAKLVYKIILPKQNKAVFGVGLLDPSEGEPNLLAKLDDDHIAALPYEIILEGTTATMLSGRFRIPLFWPHLSAFSFSKIILPAWNIEQALENICE